MRNKKLCWLILLLLAVILLGVPYSRRIIQIQLRQIIPFPSRFEALMIWRGWNPFAIDMVVRVKQEALRKIVEQNPDAWQLHQALAELSYPSPRLRQPSATRRSAEREEAITEYKKALSLNPNSAQLHLDLGIAYLAGLEFKREEEWAGHKPGSYGRKDKIAPSDIAGASSELRKTMELEPDNPFPHYLLADVLFAQHKDAEALLNLKEAMGKKNYDSHWRDALIAQLRLLKMAGLPSLESRQAISHRFFSSSLMKCRQVARIARGIGKEFERRGESGKAIDTYWGLIQMGKRMREDSSNIIESLIGTAVESIGASAYQPTQEEMKIIPASMKKRKYKANLAYEHLKNYLNQNGRKDLAKQLIPQMQESRKWRGKVIKWSQRFRKRWGFFPLLSFLNTAILAQLLIVGVFLLFISLIKKVETELLISRKKGWFLTCLSLSLIPSLILLALLLRWNPNNVIMVSLNPEKFPVPGWIIISLVTTTPILIFILSLFKKPFFLSLHHGISIASRTLLITYLLVFAVLLIIRIQDEKRFHEIGKNEVKIIQEWNGGT